MYLDFMYIYKGKKYKKKKNALSDDQKVEQYKGGKMRKYLLRVCHRQRYI